METQRTWPMYKAYCDIGPETDQEDRFPNFFSFPPKVGDFVQSQTGKVYKIKTIMHTVEINKGKYGDVQTPKTILGIQRV